VITAPCILAVEEAETLSAVLFYAFALVTVASAVAIVVSRDIVRMAVGLLFALCGVAGLYFLLGAEFLAAVQLVVYVGGTLILIVFGVMLTARGPLVALQPKRAEVILTAVIAAVLLAAIVAAIPMRRGASGPALADRSLPPGRYPVTLLGQLLLGDYLVPFEAVSVVLLVVMIGAAYLAKGRRRAEHD
jgi:NADH-quinone oxidoreductase subunit J